MSLREIFRIRKRDNQFEIGEWYVGWKSWTFRLTYSNRGYDYENAELNISMFGWHSLFRLPWKHKGTRMLEWEKEYGISIHDSTLFIHLGQMLKGWGIPFFDYGSAVSWNIYTGPKELQQCHWNASDWAPKDRDYREFGCKGATVFEYDFTDPYDGKVVKCKFFVEELEWRPKWLKWTSLFARKRRSIDVEFAEEMGARKGSWKGGILGGGYDMLPNESPMDCIKRMEKDHKYFYV